MVPDMFKQTCRTCLNTSGEMVQIFSSDIYVKQLPKKLMAFAKVEISDNDQLPKVICKKCMFLADSFYCFKEQCESADNQLKSLLQPSLNGDDSSNVDKRPDSNATCNRPGVAFITDFEKVFSEDKIPTNEAENIPEKTRETDDNYFVEYISEEVRINVENASKRRQEAERRISLEKVSQSIKNLKGIEVVPISKLNAVRIGRNDETKREEVVEFPVKVPEKRSKIIETIVVEDPPVANKRLRLPLETAVSKINSGDVERKDSIACGKHRKLDFSTVRKVVKIDDEKLRFKPKKGMMKESARENCQLKYDMDVVLSNDSDAQNRRSQYSRIINNNKGSEIVCNKQEPDIVEVKLQEEPKDDEKNVNTQLFQFSNGISNNIQDSSHRNENKKLKSIISESNSLQNEKKSTCYHSTIEESVEFPRSLESNGIQRQKVTHNVENHDVIAKSTVGCIMSGTEEQNIDVSDVLTFENGTNSPENFTGYRTDMINEFFIENEVSSTSNNHATADEEIGKNLKSDSISFAGNRKENSRDSWSFSDQVTPLALLSVNSFGQETSRLNSKIYQRGDLESSEETPKDQSLVSSAHQNTGNTNLKFYQCIICSINFVSMPAVLKHNIQEHMANESPVLCLICDKSFPDKPQLCKHVEEHNGSKPYKCTLCPKQFALKRNLKRHVDHHINYRPFQRRIGMKRLEEKSSLKSHMQPHSDNSPFACKICNILFNNKTNWQRHVVRVHEKLTVVVCKYCNKELPNKRSLSLHTRVHTGVRPYQCPHCDKRFTQQSNLNTHIHCHLNDRPFGCPHCSKRFNRRGTRDDHILTHTGEKRHKCMVCEASFTVASSLKRHMWIHTDKDRPYNCEKCKLQFVGLYDLRKHLKIRHGEVSKLDNPRLEKVLACDRSNEAVQSSRVSERKRVEITAKENSSLSCNVKK